MKNLEEVKTIISWQITRDLATKTLRICQLVYIKNLLKKKNLTNCNVPIIPIKAGLGIEINKSNDYDKANFGMYQWLIGKLIYLACKTWLDIAFVIRKLSKYNVDL